ncbi:MAG: YbhB/YbcL family Raf kinase inhibitor-like protein [Nannocystis sp.]|nr:YbhB/YbcL family Raf kinase inhibitor-like protein [Nannocystis sp.]MBA3545792.1 YbhB/YbcL family Raf kinase inhibitor-like protein [Nannocystis sp.]
MTLRHAAKVLLGKALRPLHAGEAKLIALQREVLPAREMILHSDAFELGGWIPRRHAGPGEGDNLSPPLHWSTPPPQTRELLLICEDPDAPARHPFIHWMLRVPIAATRLPEGLPEVPEPRNVPGAVQGPNSAGRLGYYGMLPPPGHGPHHYYFEIFALDEELALPVRADHSELLAAISGHVIAEGHHIGLYERR